MIKFALSLLFAQQALSNRILLQTTTAPQTPVQTPATPQTTTTTVQTIPSSTATPLPPLPEGYEYGSWGQACPIPQPGATPRRCATSGPTMNAVNPNGIADCSKTGDCCRCNSIVCGGANGPNPPQGCMKFTAGDFGAYGVQQIGILGDPASSAGGAVMECMGKYSCAESYIFAASASGLVCNDDHACSNATMEVNMPTPFFYIDCNGKQSCKGLTMNLNIGIPPPEGQMCNPELVGTTIYEFSGLKCNGFEACADLDITINNQGCDKVLMKTLDCSQLDACNYANFNFVGDIDIDNCICGPSCGFARGLGKCFQNLERFLCPSTESCQGMSKEVENPMNMFYLECGGTISCAQAQFFIRLTNSAEAPITTLEALKFGGTSSGQEVVVMIDNQQTNLEGAPVTVVIERIECTGLNSCIKATFITGANVLIGGVVCATPEACLGCRIKEFEFEEGIPCNPVPLDPVVPVPPVATVGGGGLPQFVPAPTDIPAFVPAPTEPVPAQGNPGQGQGPQGNGPQGNGPQNQFNGNPFV